MRSAEIKRTTKETDISLKLELDGSGKSVIDSGVGFMDHMLTLFAKHGRFDLELSCRGDIEVDDHHSVEDIGICLGEAMLKALGDKKGIRRYGDCILPMDEALILSAVDISGRPLLSYDAKIRAKKVGTFDTELAEEFWAAFARAAKLTLHIRQISGRNSHHIIEGQFKSVARSMRQAVSLDPELAGEIPSTKGML
ncbi:MAG: imidazoleglycerol-phosphate dehydratase HisB [Firmicutes bacterium]|nr:imidazoleglycerol-phosphate dehydratase HisB [Bacillota bacterium]MBQ2042823.1 imidazoleglycerol-phosphate dehydratase HisB [Bacillota bacterium]